MKKEFKKYLIKLEGKRLNTLYKYAPDRVVVRCLKLFTTPRKGRVRQGQKSFLETAKMAKVKVDGFQIQTYYWWGEGESVLLVHGWESNTARWEELVHRLRAAHYTVIAIDAPAHGDSEGKRFSVPLYGMALRKVVQKYKPRVAIGHSIGGTTLLYQNYREAFPYLEKMVLLAPASEMTGVMEDFQKTLGLKQELINSLEKKFKAEFGYSFSEFTMQEFAKSFDFPALWIHDKEDNIVNYKETLPVVGQWDNAQLVLTEGLGHSLRGALVENAILKFLNAG